MRALRGRAIDLPWVRGKKELREEKKTRRHGFGAMTWCGQWAQVINGKERARCPPPLCSCRSALLSLDSSPNQAACLPPSFSSRLPFLPLERLKWARALALLTGPSRRLQHGAGKVLFPSRGCGPPAMYSTSCRALRLREIGRQSYRFHITKHPRLEHCNPCGGDLQSRIITDVPRNLPRHPSPGSRHCSSPSPSLLDLASINLARYEMRCQVCPSHFGRTRHCIPPQRLFWLLPNIVLRVELVAAVFCHLPSGNGTSLSQV